MSDSLNVESNIRGTKDAIQYMGNKANPIFKKYFGGLIEKYMTHNNIRLSILFVLGIIIALVIKNDFKKLIDHPNDLIKFLKLVFLLIIESVLIYVIVLLFNNPSLPTNEISKYVFN